MPINSRWLVAGSLAVAAISLATDISGPRVVAQSLTPRPYTLFTEGTVAQDIAVSPKGGWIYIVGTTQLPTYPVTADAFDRTCGTDGTCNLTAGRFGPERRSDIVLTVFDAAGDMLYSTFLGGAGQDDNPRIALARDGTLWIAGASSTGSFEHFPASCPAGLWIARFDFMPHEVEQFSCLGAPALADLAVDADDDLWIAGTTGSQVPTRNAFQPVVAGQLDMFVAELAPGEDTPRLATYIGGSGLDIASALAITPSGSVAVVGSTNSNDFPLVRPLRSTPPASVVDGDAIVLVLDKSGRFLHFSTQWGGRRDDRATGVAVDAIGDVYVTGSTFSADLPVTAGAADPRCGTDPECNNSLDTFVSKFDPTGALLASTYYGGSGVDAGSAIATQPDGTVLVLGSTQSPDFSIVDAAPFTRWRPNVNSAHSFLGVFDARLERVIKMSFVGDETFLPSVPKFIIANHFAYVSGQLTTFTGAPAYGNYLSAVRLP